MTRPSPRKVGKALLPIWCVVGKARNDVLNFKPTLRAAAETMEAMLFESRIVKYVPSLPRKAKGARRGK